MSETAGRAWETLESIPAPERLLLSTTAAKIILRSAIAVTSVATPLDEMFLRCAIPLVLSCVTSGVCLKRQELNCWHPSMTYSWTFIASPATRIR